MIVLKCSGSDQSFKKNLRRSTLLTPSFRYFLNDFFRFWSLLDNWIRICFQKLLFAGVHNLLKKRPTRRPSTMGFSTSFSIVSSSFDLTDFTKPPSAVAKDHGLGLREYVSTSFVERLCLPHITKSRANI